MMQRADADGKAVRSFKILGVCGKAVRTGGADFPMLWANRERRDVPARLLLGKYPWCIYCGGGERATTIEHMPPSS
jgi:hypothetical protein